MWQWVKRIILVVIFLLLISIPLAMQIEAGAIEGVVTDELGPVARTSVEARNIMTGAVKLTESDGAGHYRIEGLRSGRYSLWVQAAGHNSLTIPKVLVERGETTRHDLRLRRAPTTTTGLMRDFTGNLAPQVSR